MLWHLLFSHQYEEAIEQARKVIARYPKRPFAHWYLGVACEQKQDYPGAIAALKEAASFSDATFITGGLGHAYGISGRREEALKELDKIEQQRSAGKFVTAYDLAVIRLGLGEREEAFTLLKEALDERSSWIPYLGLDPRLDPLRDDPRFKELVRKAGLSPRGGSASTE